MLENKFQSGTLEDSSLTETSERQMSNPIPATGECQHAKKSVDTTKLRKVLKTNGLVTDCMQCIKQGAKSPAAEDKESSKDECIGGSECDNALWLCLKCGSQLCGQSRNQHALQHYKTPHSDCHSLIMNTRSFEIWCYDCDSEVKSISHKNFLECVEMVKKAAHKPPPVASSRAENSDVKKNHQGQMPNPTSATGVCQHSKKSVDTTKLRNVLKTNRLATVCMPCIKQSATAEAAEVKESSMDEPIGGFEYDNTLWLCLKCGSQLCGRSRNQHALQHYKTLHSDCHLLAINTRSFEIWCYDCDNEVKSNSHKNLLKCVEIVKKAAQKPPPPVSSTASNTKQLKNVKSGKQSNKPPPPPPIPRMAKRITDRADVISAPTLIIKKPQNNFSSRETGALPRVRGLKNLGNTCFFNAVMQCLAQTPYLLDMLKEMSEPAEEINLPGGTFKFKDDEDVYLPMIKGTLSPWGGLTAALAQALEELQSGGGVFTPTKLFNKLCTKCPQFWGGDQHDAHELLRHLLESVRSEDLKRYQRVILTNLGFNNQDISRLSEKMRQKFTIYSNQASDRILCPEQVFRGFLVSTLTCQRCFNASSGHEYFLDMSLPVSVGNPPPSAGSSKAQLNKEKWEKYKAQRAAKYHESKLTASTEIGCANREDDVGYSSSTSSSEQSNADVEENLRTSNVTPEHMDKESEYDSGIASSPDNAGSNFLSSTETDGECMNGEQLKLSEQKATRKKARCIRTQRQSHSDWSTTMGPHYQCEDDECSVQSCLNNFTGVELMTGNNKVDCANCTKRIKDSNPKAKTVKTNATKQFLISSPPAVLILHLKRFQLDPCNTFRKVTRDVSFPMVLDIAPCCGSKVKNLPNIDCKQKKLLYALYGIVEHSGGINGGHYTAYVKVRTKLSRGDKRWNFLEQGSKTELEQDDGQRKKLEELLAKEKAREFCMKVANDSDDFTSSDDCSSTRTTTSTSSDADELPTDDVPATAGNGDGDDDEARDVQVPMGKWYYVSDSLVQEVKEETVLKAQAYLLFYERIY